MEFTPQQQRVIAARNHNILVSAAAGSGKTAVLVERIIQMICDPEHPLDIDRLLVVTFTRAAAAQMRERIGQAISARLLTDPLNMHLQKQETLLHKAQITTIDSFCTWLLRNNFSEIDLDPGYRVMEEAENTLLLHDTCEKFIGEQYEKAEPAFFDCVEYFCPGSGDQELEKLLITLLRAADSQPDPVRWLRDRKKDYEISDVQDLLSRNWMRDLLAGVADQIRSAAAVYDTMLELSFQPGGPYVYVDLLEEEKKTILQTAAELDGLLDTAENTAGCTAENKAGNESGEVLIDRRTWERFHAAAAMEFGRLPAIKKTDDSVEPELKDRVTGLRKGVKESFGKLQDRFFFEDISVHARRMQEAAKPLGTLIELTIGLLEAFAAARKEKNAVNFSDLEHLALQVLLEAQEDGTYRLRPVAASYRDYFDEVLIDEYQDSNAVQELLLTAITEESKGRYARFMVGDVKQSIYRFRGARPEIFIDKFGTYRQEDPVTERIDLDRNFRSRPEVLDSVNDVFSRIMRREIGGVDYDEAAALKYPGWEPGRHGFAEDSPYITELLLIDENDENGESGENTSSDAEGSADANSSDNAEDSVEQLSAHKEETLAIARKIRSMVGHFMIPDPSAPAAEGGVRPLRYGDIVILLRATGSWIDAFRETFDAEGIPLYAEYKAGYFAAQEIRQVLQLLRIVSNPRQDIPLYGVLHGYFGGFSEEEIAKIRTQGGLMLAGILPESESSDSKNRESGRLYDSLRLYAGVPVEGRELKEPELPELQKEKKPELPDLQKEKELEQPELQKEKESELLDLQMEIDPELKEKCAAFLKSLEKWREASAYMPIHELIGEMIYATGYADYVAAHPAGTQRSANLVSLLTKAGSFEQTAYTGVFDFLRYIDQMHQYEVDYGEANVLDENADVVRIMTIHKSKGLEFPVCFVAGLSGRFAFKTMDTTGDILCDADMGLGINYIDLNYRGKVTTLRKEAVAEKIRLDAFGEELRVLYVAMTRAKDKVILTGTVKDLAASLISAGTAARGSKNALQLPTASILSAGNFLDLILMATAGMESSSNQTSGAPSVKKVRIGARTLRNSGEEDQTSMAEKKSVLQKTASLPLEQLPLPSLAEELKARFAGRYAREDLKDLYTKTSVSELKHAAIMQNAAGREMTGDSVMGDLGTGALAGNADAEGGAAMEENTLFPQEVPAPYIPRFVREKEEKAGKEEASSGAEYGTAVHRVCQILDYRRWPDPSMVSEKDFELWADSMVAAGEIEQAYIPILKPQTFLPFLHSQTAARMAAAETRGQLRREQPFVHGISASRMDPVFPSDETILVQGIIDAFFIENGKIIVVDYKTDRVRSPKTLIDRYQVQLDYYADALGEMLGLPVSEKIIYSFALQKEIWL